jgi:hypothetical protein
VEAAIPEDDAEVRRRVPGLQRGIYPYCSGFNAPRREKIAEAKRGKARPAPVREAVRRAHLGGKHTEEAKARMSAAHPARGTRPPKAGVPWTPEEDDLLRTLPTAEVSERTGRTLPAVYSRRRELGRVGIAGLA